MWIPGLPSDSAWLLPERCLFFGLKTRNQCGKPCKAGGKVWGPRLGDDLEEPAKSDPSSQLPSAEKPFDLLVFLWSILRQGRKR